MTHTPTKVNNYVAITGIVEVDPGVTVGDREVIAEKVQGIGQVLTPGTTTRVIHFELRADDEWDLRGLLGELNDEVTPMGGTLIWDKADLTTGSEEVPS